MANLWNVISLILISLTPMISSKGIILYGKGKVGVGKKNLQTSSPEEAEEHVDKFRFALFTPTTKTGTPSESFLNFSQHAISARLTGHNRKRTYYFMQDKKTYDATWMSDSNVCQAEAKSWQLHPNGDFLFADSDQQVTVYFLCDHYCCSTQCCDINVIFVVCMIFFALLGLTIPTWLCCRYGRRYFKRPKIVEQDEFYDAEENFSRGNSQRNPAHHRHFHRTQSLPLRGYNGDDVRL